MPLYRDFTTVEELDAQYDIEASVPDFGVYVEQFIARSAAARAGLDAQLDVPYGPTLAETVDVFPGAGPGPRPTVLFVHGGYWKVTTSKEWSYVATGLVQRGVTVVVENYALCPAVTVREIVRQHRAAFATLYRDAEALGVDRSRIVVAGHSAGGHAAASLVGTDWAGEYGLPAAPIAGVLGVSGLYDLRPLPRTFANPWLGLDAGEAAAQPLRHPRRPRRRRRAARPGRHAPGRGPLRQDGAMTVRWGIVGPGRIASKVVADLPLVPGAEAVAVASRSIDRAKAFAAEHGIVRAHGSYRDIVDDAGVDVLYIATPHPQHRAVALAALRAGKAVLVEKAFTVTPQATREIAALAAGTGVFAMEAMWTRFQPAVVAMRELIAGGAVGEVRAVQADLGVRNPLEPGDRFVAPELGGGALFDLTVYPISFAQMVLGDPTGVSAHGLVTDDGVDLEESVVLTFASGATATSTTTLRCATPGQARVFGTDGWIDVLPRFHHPDTLVLHRDGREPEEITRPHVGGGYHHELLEVTECVAAGRGESTVMPLADTIAVQDAMGEVAAQLGMHPQEGPAELQ